MNTRVTPIVLHGGAERLPVHWVNAPEPPARISRYRVAPGDEVSRHVHTGKAEYWVIVAGSGIARVGESSIPVSEGDIVATPPAVPHALLNTGDTPLIFVNIVQPTGNEPITTVELGS